jgi:hypothetical protein
VPSRRAQRDLIGGLLDSFPASKVLSPLWQALDEEALGGWRNE